MTNKRKNYHGSARVSGGKLIGTTDTDYFYFFCPICTERQVLRLLDFEIRDKQLVNPYNQGLKSKAAKGFTLAFNMYCEKCNFSDIVKISNLGRQTGPLEI